MIIEPFAPQGGVDLSELDRMNAAGTGSENGSIDYAVSKAGNWVSITLVSTRFPVLCVLELFRMQHFGLNDG